ncbi:hypothetical protein G6F46_006896 [Rhizopus delemar]|nr:hypothetical protein G6F55_012032 [Rhizopus delemar]KAG1552236.1 hypothetical protein G6F51_001357 [Rhizopus arrhizus]KAG1489331.1 hypothetical protein G6F54_011516 [Rhizopus delemar]KAG1500638.1 hypothetical protein G6F53_011258 [Rhizopus delemar]KAG1508697.1 hypothetical protein G6F52_011325 [Rhizopus delemar]
MDETTQLRVMTFMRENLNNIPFKTLRLGEAELDDKDKLTQMNATLESDPGLFLSKWGRYLSQSILSLFQCMQDNYEVKFYLSSLLYKENTPPPKANTRNQRSALYTLSQNRRYEYLKRQLRHSDYFSDESIQLREPELYEQYVGQYIPESEKNKPFGKDVTLVNRILSNIDQKYVSDRLERRRIIEEEQFEEEEEEESENEDEVSVRKEKEDDVEMHDGNREAFDDKLRDKAEDGDEIEEDIEEDIEDMIVFREEKRQELVRLLEEKFLAGKDDFNYAEVDYNEDYDDLEQQERDFQDRYFDDEDDY